MIQILTNHMGYLCGDSKKAVLQGKKGMKVGNFSLYNRKNQVVFSGEAVECGEVANWNTGNYWILDFSEYCEEGRNYRLEASTSEGTAYSFPFDLSEHFLDMRMMNAAAYYFKAQRSTGEWADADSNLKYSGQEKRRKDVHGGWFDATGDAGIHMSHLSDSSVCNPQQVPFSSYVFFKTAEILSGAKNRQYTYLIRRMLDEGIFGADFIMRSVCEDGNFLRTIDRADDNVFDAVQYSRKIGFEYCHSSSQFGEAVTAGEEIIRDQNYETSLRCGGGLCIAALAAAARHSYPGSDFSTREYLRTAEDSFAFLRENNERFANDGKWNLLDEYCALIAAVELYRTTESICYLNTAEDLYCRMKKRVIDTGDGGIWFESRPGEWYVHAAEEGMPIVALLEFAKIEQCGVYYEEAVSLAQKALRHKLAVSSQGNNPFGYAKYRYSKANGTMKDNFFYFHDNPAQPWWQGDNARIASLATAAWEFLPFTNDESEKQKLNVFAQDQINWILGMNPFDSCMMEGYGRNNVPYFFQGRYEYMNCPGGIINGITSTEEDEDGILLCDERDKEDRAVNKAEYDNWRWGEQWIPHVSWFIFALAQKKMI